MELECTCVGIGEEKWNQLMNGGRKLNYEWLKRKVRKNLPELYNALSLDFYNPWEDQAKVTKTHYILVWSGIEYFIKK